jgi:hypothetical protein
MPGMNGIWLDTVGGLDPALLQTGRDRVEALGVPFWLQVRASLAPAREIDALADALGLELKARVPGMFVTPAELANPDDPSLEAEPIGGDRLDQMLAVSSEGFGIPAEAMAPMYTPAVLSREGLTMYLARVDGRPVSAAITYRRGPAIGVFNVATPPSDRRRGYGGAITRHACAEAFDRGAGFAWLQASDMGEPVYRRLGFREIESYLLFARPG